MKYPYQYIKLHGEPKRHVCIQQNPITLAWVLFFKKNTLHPLTFGNGFKKWTLQWIKNGIWKYYSFSRSNLIKLKLFLIYKYNFRKIDSFIELPFYGQTCVLVNKGYKIFDLRRGLAIKVYREDIDIPTIKAELERLKKGNLFDFAPSIKRWNINDRWYEEDYIGGSLDRSLESRNSSVLLDKFYKDVAPCLESLILQQSPVTKNTIDYVSEIKSILVSDNLWRERLDTEKIDKILDFIYSIIERLRSEEGLSFFRVLTHGDFCPANMLYTKRGLRVLDWESADFRSALFDFYSYFFYRPLHQKYPLDLSISEINLVLPKYINMLDVTSPEISASLKSFEKIYRWLFYIERLYILIEREKDDTKLNILGSIFRYIEIFNCYEEITTDYTDKLKCFNV